MSEISTMNESRERRNVFLEKSFQSQLLCNNRTKQPDKTIFGTFYSLWPNLELNTKITHSSTTQEHQYCGGKNFFYTFSFNISERFSLFFKSLPDYFLEQTWWYLFSKESEGSFSENFNKKFNLLLKQVISWCWRIWTINEEALGISCSAVKRNVFDVEYLHINIQGIQ